MLKPQYFKMTIPVSVKEEKTVRSFILSLCDREITLDFGRERSRKDFDYKIIGVKVVNPYSFMASVRLESYIELEVEKVEKVVKKNN